MMSLKMYYGAKVFQENKRTFCTVDVSWDTFFTEKKRFMGMGPPHEELSMKYVPGKGTVSELGQPVVLQEKSVEYLKELKNMEFFKKTKAHLDPKTGIVRVSNKDVVSKGQLLFTLNPVRVAWEYSRFIWEYWSQREKGYSPESSLALAALPLWGTGHTTSLGGNIGGFITVLEEGMELLSKSDNTSLISSYLSPVSLSSRESDEEIKEIIYGKKI